MKRQFIAITFLLIAVSSLYVIYHYYAKPSIIAKPKPSNLASTKTQSVSLPSADDIADFSADPIDADYADSVFKNFKVDEADMKYILTFGTAVTKEQWLYNSHVVGGDRTGTFVLRNGQKMKWFVRPAGLATLTGVDNKVIYIVYSGSSKHPTSR